jgi:hypothetical protein
MFLELALNECVRTPAPEEIIFDLDNFLEGNSKDENLENPERGEEDEQFPDEISGRSGYGDIGEYRKEQTDRQNLEEVS